MKNLVLMLVAVLSLAIVSCGGVDKELAGKMQKDMEEMNGTGATLEELGKNIANLTGQMNAAPEAMKSDGGSGLQPFLEMANTMIQKQQATLAEYNDLMSKLKTLSADYSASKIQTEQAAKEYETLKKGLQGISDVTGRIKERSVRMETNFAKMTADWNARHESGAAPSK